MINNKKFKIRRIIIKQYKCFPNVDIHCEKDDKSLYQWTVLLGNNNTGKTSLLKAIANLRPVEFSTIEKNRMVLAKEGEEKKQYIPAIFYDRESLEELESYSFIGCETAQNELSQWTYRKNAFSVSDKKSMNDFHIYGYGVSRYPAKTSLAESNCSDCASLFSPDKKLINIEEWLMQLDYAAKNDKPHANDRLYKIKELLCGNLFPEILDFKFESSESLKNYVLFKTKDGWFRYTQLGYGYQSMLSWIIDLCKRMFDRYPESQDPLLESAIVLVDEIDLHLHPKWQRDIISFLSKSFPNVQFIVTSHSPLVIQSMDEVNLYTLHRHENLVKVEKCPYTNFIGWTVEEILRDIMKLDKDIHSDEYQENMNLFDEGLDENDISKAKQAYDVLRKILHPTSSVRRLLDLQFSQMKQQ